MIDMGNLGTEFRGRDRNTAHAALGGEFPTRTLSIVRRVPNSTITHVSASPPTIPDGRISPAQAGF
jgi:hypothetical protein